MAVRLSGSPGEPFAIEGAPGFAVRGFLHKPAGPAEDGIVLAHGAGSNANAPQLIQIAHAFAGAGLLALRVDLPFRQARPKGPPHPSAAALDRQGLRSAIEAVRELGAKRLLLGGHSYGGRQASMLASEEPSLVGGLLLLSYPLHPPENALKLRTAHFPQLYTPVLFVHGEKDPFATSAEMRDAVALIPAFTSVIEIPGVGHDLRRMPVPEIVRETLGLLA